MFYYITNITRFADRLTMSQVKIVQEFLITIIFEKLYFVR